MADLRDELDHAIAERDRLNVVIAYLEGRVNGAAAAATKPSPAVGGGRKTRLGKPTTIAAAIEALNATGHPMKTPELLKAVQALGAQIKDSDNLYKTLTRHSKPPHATFKRTGRGLWTLA